MDIPYSCGGGFACLQTGYLEEARKVHRFLDRLYDAQRELPDRFFYTWSRDRQAVITTFPAERQIAHVVVNQDPRRQRWTIGGIAAEFLCRLYLADPRQEYLELARKYQQFSMIATPGQFNWAHVCKSSRAASWIRSQAKTSTWNGRIAWETGMSRLRKRMVVGTGQTTPHLAHT